MSPSSSTTFCHALPVRPPTSNTLDPRQRTRLIRTTRKLGAVLGTTPQLLEQESSVPSPTLLPIAGRSSPARKTSAYRKRRQGSVFELPPSTTATFYDSASSDASSSVSSLSLSRSSIDSVTSYESASSLPPAKSFTRHVREKSRSKGRQAPLPTPLVLRLNAVPLPPSDPRVQHPITPDSSATLSFAQSASCSPMLPTTPTTPLTPTVTETRRKRLAKLKRTLGENVPAELVLPFRSAGSRARQSSASPSSASPTTPPAAPATPRARTAPQATLPRPPRPQPQSNRRRSMSVDFSVPQSAPAPTPSPALASAPERRSSRVWITGNGNWTGEWNRRDIREVQNQLRALRAR